MEECILKTWNYKYNQYCPCKIIKKLDDKIVKIHRILQIILQKHLMI